MAGSRIENLQTCERLSAQRVELWRRLLLLDRDAGRFGKPNLDRENERAEARRSPPDLLGLAAWLGSSPLLISRTSLSGWLLPLQRRRSRAANQCPFGR
jgi:hypothetical protein